MKTTKLNSVLIAVLCITQVLIGIPIAFAAEQAPLEFDVKVLGVSNITLESYPLQHILIATVNIRNRVNEQIEIQQLQASALLLRSSCESDPNRPNYCGELMEVCSVVETSPRETLVTPMGQISVLDLGCRLSDSHRGDYFRDLFTLDVKIEGRARFSDSDDSEGQIPIQVRLTQRIARDEILRDKEILKVVHSNQNYLSTLVTSGITGMPQALEELKRLILGVPVKVKMALQFVFDRILRMLREILRRLPPLRRA